MEPVSFPFRAFLASLGHGVSSGTIASDAAVRTLAFLEKARVWWVRRLSKARETCGPRPN